MAERRTVWHSGPWGGTSSKPVGPGQEPQGPKVLGSGPSGGCALWKEAGEAPVPTKCCLSASGRGAGADSQGYVNSNEEEDKTPETLIKHRPTERQEGRTVPAGAGEFLTFSVPGLSPEAARGLWAKTASLPRKGSGKEDIWKTSLFWEKGLWRQCGAGRAGMSREGGVSRQSRDGGRCRGVLLPAGWQAFQCFPRSPCTRAGH